MYPRRPCVLSLSREVVGKSECNLNLLKRNSALVCHVAIILDSESESARANPLHSALTRVTTEVLKLWTDLKASPRSGPFSPSRMYVVNTKPLT